jgi:hypothetical protein
MDTTTDSRPPRALEDASGRRLRRLRWIGRAVALLFLLWFAAILLGALGVGPTRRVPLGHVLRPAAGPSPVGRLPTPRPPAPADLVPALPVVAVARRSPTPSRAPVRRAAPGRSGIVPGHLTATVRGRSSSAPGHLRAPGVEAPGRLRHATTTATTTTATTPTQPGRRRSVGKTR